MWEAYRCPQEFLRNYPRQGGLHFRTYAGEADIPEMTRVMNAATEANGNPEYQPEELVRNELKHASSTDPREDVVLAFVGHRVIVTGDKTRLN